VRVQSKRNKDAALKLMRKLLKNCSFVPDRVITDDLRSYGDAAQDVGIDSRHERGRWNNNRGAEFASADPTKGAQDATHQEPKLSAERSLNPRRRLQHLWHPTSPHIGPNATHVSRRGDEHVARGSYCRVKIHKLSGQRALGSTT
jgi:transposase-like protein